MPQLTEYARKRDFKVTSEPPAAIGKAPSASAKFVVQWHKARRDHFDFRLEMDGVLKSWAVTRGPSANPRTRRLAVRTEDHPLEYADFEGDIPQGEYGGGLVMLWDQGRWRGENGDPKKALEEGSLKFSLNGKRMKGRWALVRMKTEGRQENWLLIKEKDSFAENDDSLAEKYTESIKSKRTFDQLSKGQRVKPPKADIATIPVPKFRQPMLCHTASTSPEGEEWIYEMKYDGYRLQVAIGSDEASVRTRNGHDWTGKFPGIAEAATNLGLKSAILDGEAVVLNSGGVSDFPALVSAIQESASNPSIVFMAFDVLQTEGRDVTALPLRERKKILIKMLSKAPSHGAIRLASAVSSGPASLIAAIVKAGGEGLVAKKIEASYTAGRSYAWQKVKAKQRDDAIIVGWYPSARGRQLASIAVAVKTGRKLTYVGRVGTGFDARSEAALLAKLQPFARLNVPVGLNGGDLIPRGIRWVEPRVMAAIVYASKTGDGLLRGASFLGLREDLDAPERKPAARGSAVKVVAASKKDGPVAVTPVTHPSRVVFPKAGFTKGDLAEYYSRVASRIMPHLRNRPVSLLRAPSTIDEELFFQRHPMPAMKIGIARVPSPDRKRDSYLAIESAQGLRTVVQFGAVEIHGWGAVLPNLNAPDRLVMDLDPAEDVPFSAVADAALLIRKILKTASLKSFVLASGGKGVHVIAPLDQSQSWEAIEIFTSGIARVLARHDSSRYIAKSSKAARNGRIYVDWLRNKLTATAIVPYSVRARENATIACPVTWDQLSKLKAASAFTAREFNPAGADPWRVFFSTVQAIPESAIDHMRGII